jgi:hypothetical protein
LDSFAVTGSAGWRAGLEGWAIRGLGVPAGYVAALSAAGDGDLPTASIPLPAPRAIARAGS